MIHSGGKECLDCVCLRDRLVVGNPVKAVLYIAPVDDLSYSGPEPPVRLIRFWPYQILRSTFGNGHQKLVKINAVSVVIVSGVAMATKKI